MALINWIQWNEKVVAMNHATLVDVTNRPLRDYLNSIGIDPDGDITPPTTGVVNENVYYVGKHGSDSNSGRNLSNAFLTFGAATAVASSGFTIVCLDSGVYSELVSVSDEIGIFAPYATITAPIGSGTTALDINASGNFVSTSYIVGSIIHTGNQSLRNTALKTALNVYLNIDIGRIVITGTNITGLDINAYSSVKVGKLEFNAVGVNAIGLDCSSTVDIQIASMNVSHSNSGTPGPIGLNIVGNSFVSGHIGEIIDSSQSSSTPMTGIAATSGKAHLTVDAIRSRTGPASSLLDAINVTGGELNISVGYLSSLGNAYKISSGTLRLWALFMSGSAVSTGGTLVAKQLSDIP